LQPILNRSMQKNAIRAIVASGADGTIHGIIAGLLTMERMDADQTFPRADLAKTPFRIGKASLPSRYLLAPLAGFTNVALRLALRDVGGLGLATSDLVNARALMQRSKRTMELVETTPEDRPLSIQIYGKEPAELSAAAQWLQEYGVTTIDINMGCPVHKITRGGGGAALMCEPDRAIALVESVVKSVSVPVTVKMRLGWDDQTLSAPYFARAFEDVGVAAVTVHGRTREQAFKGAVKREGIRAVVEAVRSIPIIGNGDIRNAADARLMFEETGCTAIAIGRGALLNPWIFSQLDALERTGETPRIASFGERLRFMHRHYHLLVRFRGEHIGSLLFRKVANWYCRVLKPGKDLQQKLIRIDSINEFDEIVAEIGRRIDLRGTDPLPDYALPVPGGPIEHW
jgi:tRNA-dihydrouridine synthase B